MPTRTMNKTFFESSSGSGFREPEPAAVICAPRPRRVQVHPCSADLILGPPPFLLNISSGSKKNEGKAKGLESQIDGDEDEDGGWGLFGGSPPARADNPLVHDPLFLLNQRHQLPDSPSELGILDHLSRGNNYSHRPTYTSSSSSNSNFAPSFAPAVRIQGFDVSSCRSSHSSSGGRVLSARA